MFGPALSGHYAAMAGTGIIGENMLVWKIGGAVWTYTHTLPSKTQYFCHHPYGAFWAAALAILVLGRHDWVLPFTAVAMSSATVALLWSVVRRRYGEIPAAAAVCGWAFLPIALVFGDFLNLEVVVMFGLALFFWGHDRFLATSKRRHLVASVIGVFVATTGDWAGYIGVGLVLAWGLLRAVVLPAPLTEPIRRRAYLRWWALCTATAILTLIYIVWAFHSADKIGEWLASAKMRGGDGMPLARALANRHTWIEVMFTPVAISLGKIGLPVCAAWFVARRRDADVYALAAFAQATVQYLAFKKGADVHIYWPHHFALYYAFALAEITAAVVWIAGRFAGTSVRRGAMVSGALGMATFLVPTAVMAPDAVRALRWGRQSGGRFNNNATGHNRATNFRTEEDMLFVLRWLRGRLGDESPSGITIDVPRSTQWGWEHSWELHAVVRQASGPATPTGPANRDRPYYVARGSSLGPGEMERIAASGHVRAYGDIWVIDEREPAGPIDVFSLGEHTPSLPAWYLFWGASPARQVPAEPDPWLTWEMRRHLGVEPAIVPQGDPATLEQLRVAYDLAGEAGDSARAEALRERIDGQIDRTANARFEDGTELIGVRVTTGSQPVLEAWFVAGGPMATAPYFDVSSEVIARNPWSTIPRDDVQRELSFPPLIPTRLWKKGYIYHHDATMLHRIGVERYTGSWTIGGPQRADHQAATVLCSGT